MFWVTSLYSFFGPIIVFLFLRCLNLFEACADLGQIAKLSPGVLVGYTELVWFEQSFANPGFGSAATPSKFKVFCTVLCLSDESSADVYLGYGNFIGTTSVS